MNVLKDTKDDSQKVHYRAKMESYFERAEKLKKLVREQQEAGTFHEKLNITEGSTGYSYRRVFEKYLEGNVQEVVVEDPYIRNIHQIYNFLRFCELLVRKGTVRNIKLLTSKWRWNEYVNFLFLTAAILVTAHLLSCHATPSRKLLPLGREVKTRGARGWGRGEEFFLGLQQNWLCLGCSFKRVTRMGLCIFRVLGVRKLL